MITEFILFFFYEQSAQHIVRVRVRRGI